MLLVVVLLVSVEQTHVGALPQSSFSQSWPSLLVSCPFRWPFATSVAWYGLTWCQPTLLHSPPLLTPTPSPLLHRRRLRLGPCSCCLATECKTLEPGDWWHCCLQVRVHPTRTQCHAHSTQSLRQHIAVWPANIYCVFDAKARNAVGMTPALALIRVPLQGVFFAWAYQLTTTSFRAAAASAGINM